VKTKLCSWGAPYVKRAAIFLTAVALVLGTASCAPATTKYHLTMAANPVEGGTAIDVTNASPYAAGTNVTIRAQAAEGYMFAYWSAPAGTFADANAAETTFTMPAQNVTVTANFILGTPIQTWYDLDAIRQNPDGHYVLVNDLDETTSGYAEVAGPAASDGKGWQPIGSVAANLSGGTWEPVNPFTGTFDGQGYEIRDLYINRPTEDGVGLFGSIDGAVIEHVGLVSVNVTGRHVVGALVGGQWTNSEVRKCYSSGTVTAMVWQVGGLVGSTDGTISASYSSATVLGGLVTGGLVGGIWVDATVENSYATGNVTAGLYYAGGLTGGNYGTIRNCYSTGFVVASMPPTGGLSAVNYGTVENSFWDTETSGQASSAGGTGKSTAEMKAISTFSGAGWSIVAVANPGTRNPSYTWNIVNGVTYPFLSWQPAS